MERVPTEVFKHWFGCDPLEFGQTVIVMERDRLDDFSAAISGRLQSSFSGVFSGRTLASDLGRITILAGVSRATVVDCVYLLSAAGISRVVSTGTAGGLSGNVGEILISAESAQLGNETDWLETGCELGEESLIRYVSHSELERMRSLHGDHIYYAWRYGPLFTVPAVAWETSQRLTRLRDAGFLGVDLESAVFLRSCAALGMQAFCLRWITDLPLSANFSMTVPLLGAPEVRARRQMAWVTWPRAVVAAVALLWPAP